MIEERRGEGVLGIVIRDFEDERLQHWSMGRRVEDTENLRTQLPILGAEVEFTITVRGVGEGKGELGQGAGEGLPDGERGPIRAVNEFPGAVGVGYVDLAPETTMLESDVAPKTTDMGNRDPLEVDLETLLSLKLLGQIEEDFRQDLRGKTRDGTKRVPARLEGTNQIIQTLDLVVDVSLGGFDSVRLAERGDGVMNTKALFHWTVGESEEQIWSDEWTRRG